MRIILQVLAQRTIPVVKNSILNEKMYGRLQVLNKAEITKEYGAEQVKIWRRTYAICPPEGESLASTFDRRVPYYKNEIEPKLRTGKNVLLVTHYNNLKAVMMYLGNISPKDIEKINIPTGLP